MATYRKVPAKILTVDYVGVSTSQSETYRKRAEAELSKLEGQVLRGNLDQGFRMFNLSNNVKVECTVCFNLKQATVIIGSDVVSELSEKPCYCCSPCLVAGRIIRIANVDEETEEPIMEEDKDYYADILVCQAPDATTPKSIVLHEERRAGGAAVMRERVLQNRTYEAVEMYDVIFSDYQRHRVGDSVLVLVQPLYNFVPDGEVPYPGEFLSCINKGQVANGSVPEPQPSISVDYINSTGQSCQIVKDEQIWTEEEENPEEGGDPKYFPFRILPIKIDSCL